MGEVVDLNSNKGSEVDEDFPIAQFGFVDNVAAQVFGDIIGYSVTPAQTPDGEMVVVMHVGSLKYSEIVRKAIFDMKDFSETRKACIVLAYEIFALENKYDNSAGGKLIVPESGLIIPGK